MMDDAAHETTDDAVARVLRSAETHAGVARFGGGDATAIQREGLIKSWTRAWKVRLITGMNPNWDDLYEHING